MSTLAHRVAVKAFEADISAVRGFSALRRAIVVVIVLLLGTWWVSPVAGAYAAVAALLIGLLDKGRSPRATWEVMGLTTIVFTVATAISGVLTHSQVAITVMATLLAFAGGVSIAVDARAPQIFIFTALLIGSHLVRTDLDADPALISMVALAGALQTLASLAASPLIGDQPERRQIAATMRTIARNCIQLRDSELGPARTAAQQAAKSMSATEELIKRGDISTDDRTRYAILLADLEKIRFEARAFTGRIYLGIPVARKETILNSFQHVAQVLIAAADALEHRSSHKATAQLSEIMKIDPPPTNDSPTATILATAISGVPLQVEDILHRHRVHREFVENSKPLGSRIKAAFAPDSTSLKYGYRLGSAVLVGYLLAIASGIPQGFWIASSAMMLLRPDTGPTAPRILMRAIGTVIAVALLLLILPFATSTTTRTLIMIALSLFLIYSLAAINYSAQTALITIGLILMACWITPNPEMLAFERLINVSLGCLLGIVFAVAMPIWKRGQLRSDLANYAEASAAWFQAIAEVAELPTQERVKEMPHVRAVSNKVRGSRTTAVTTLQTALLEPAHEHIDVGQMGIVLSWIRRTADAGIAAESVLLHGLPASPNASTLAMQTSKDLQLTADNLRSDETQPLPPEAVRALPLASESLDRVTSDRATALLARAEISASAALRASYKQGSTHVAD